ncbi:MAG: PKD domain-containing protein [Candidatus Competibacteraceae bacterium]
MGTPLAFAGQASLAWDPSTSTGVGGYRLYYGQTSQNYTANVDVGNQTSHTLTNLQDGATYYFAVTAYDTSATAESDYSNEVSKTIPSVLQAGFTASPVFGEVPLTVTFTDQSSGATNSNPRSWDFGDNTSGSGLTAFKTYTEPGTYTVTLRVDGPNGSSDEITKADVITVTVGAPVANFSASPVSGTAPLSVQFQNDSAGNITSYSWDFGDGNTSTAPNPSHTYSVAGSYTVKMTATGPGGSNTKIRNDLVTVSASDTDPGTGSGTTLIEIGEVAVDHHWKQVNFTNSFVNPIVVSTSLSNYDADPAVIRIRNVTPEGFEIRLQEWDYLDGYHESETVGYLAMEEGSHLLDDGTLVEAGRFTSNNTSYKTAAFEQDFFAAPIVMAAVTSFHEADAVTIRLRNISKTGFQFRLQEQELNAKSHNNEEISWIAWEASSGRAEKIEFESSNRACDQPPIFR